MKDNNLIALSLIYFDIQKEKYKKYYKKNIDLILQHVYDEDLYLPNFIFKKNNLQILEGDYNIIGIFYKNTNEFRWGWDFIYLSKNNNLIKNNTYFIRQIINYILDFNINKDNLEQDIFLYTNLKEFFLKPKILIKNKLELEIILAITQFITKSEMIYKKYDKKNNIDKFYLLKNIKIYK